MILRRIIVYILIAVISLSLSACAPKEGFDVDLKNFEAQLEEVRVYHIEQKVNFFYASGYQSIGPSNKEKIYSTAVLSVDIDLNNDVLYYKYTEDGERILNEGIVSNRLGYNESRTNISILEECVIYKDNGSFYKKDLLNSTTSEIKNVSNLIEAFTKDEKFIMLEQDEVLEALDGEKEHSYVINQDITPLILDDLSEFLIGHGFSLEDLENVETKVSFDLEEETEYITFYTSSNEASYGNKNYSISMYYDVSVIRDALATQSKINKAVNN